MFPGVFVLFAADFLGGFSFSFFLGREALLVEEGDQFGRLDHELAILTMPVY